MQRQASDIQRRRASDALLLSAIAVAVIVGKVISAGLSPVHLSQAEFAEPASDESAEVAREGAARPRHVESAACSTSDQAGDDPHEASSSPASSR